MNILHLSDIHFKYNYKVDNLSNEYYDIISTMRNPKLMLDEILEDCKEIKIDLVVISGDLTESGSEEDYRELKKYLLEKFEGIDILVTIGNHDIKKNFYTAWLEKDESSFDDNYFYGKVYWKNDIAFISFDNSKYGYNDGYIDENRLEWLRKALIDIGDKKSVLITHHHLSKEQGNIPALENKELLDVIENSNIVAVLCGHTHHFYEGYIRNKRVYISVGSSFQGFEIEKRIVKFKEGYGYNIYNLKNNGINLIRKKIFKGRYLGIVDFNM